MPTKKRRRLRRLSRLRRLGIRTQTSKDPEAGFARGQLVELGVEAANVLGATVVATFDLGAADRERLVGRLDGAELTGRLGGLQQVEVDLHVEDLLHAANVGVPELLVR